jgi:hypothetical protein
MAARFALVPFCFFNTVTTTMECVEQGASRDSVTSQAFLQTPASYWSASALVAGVNISPQMAAYLAAYPNT